MARFYRFACSSEVSGYAPRMRAKSQTKSQRPTARRSYRATRLRAPGVPTVPGSSSAKTPAQRVHSRFLGERGPADVISASPNRAGTPGFRAERPHEPRRARLRPWPGRWAPIRGRPYSGLALGNDAPLALPSTRGQARVISFAARSLCQRSRREPLAPRDSRCSGHETAL
jgi:hypothetical protein